MGVEFAEGSPQRGQAELVLQLASAWARSIARKAWASVDAIPDWRRDTVVGIILAASRRELQNPRRVIYEVHGPDSASYNQSSCPPGFFTEPEERYLLSCKGSTGSWWAMETYRDDPEVSTGYLYAANSAHPIPMYAPYDSEGWENSDHP